MAYVYLRKSDNNKYGALKTNLQSQFTLQNNQYPKSINKTTYILTNHQWDDKYKFVRIENSEFVCARGKTVVVRDSETN